ncbi:hypothetical protein [Natronobacterium texcoconense]|uniref:Uncharacterized protein n=1 Tax=Natronobacterium texcoconense TaxID=1095778 RepID=A0A1H1J1E5_NATTX|nr:hypothetical protein [Natronobacterium texcoconense]SDR43723.1 hypothetical protein SAMN04489842_3998 [Natronobacterium texcoconense]
MMWQDFVFLAGSVLSITFLAPTVRDTNARVPLGSSVPSMTIGSVYSFTYATMGMTFSALGSLGVAVMWSLIAFYRAPGPQTGPKNILQFVRSLARQGHDLVTTAIDSSGPSTTDREQAAD